LKEWLKQCAAGKKNGNHDAFEWLILHVVIPDTQAASEPRWREAVVEDAEELKERKSGAKWPGKSKRTVFDKLRADFNEAGKTGQDRVAQIKLPRDNFPIELLPAPAVAATIKETQEERDKAWLDLIGKVRTLTLSSFDVRVRQYEADIVAQEARRSMPGFNFCTFFIYKEGLAKALESIGLVEDSLVIYDELSLGLESVIRDIASGNAEGTATTFAPYTEDIKERILGGARSMTNGNGTDDDDFVKSPKAAETTDGEYRDRIARSNISVFDFFGYLFSRQKAMILRLAHTQADGATSHLSTHSESEDLVLISEVCWRAAAFIHNNARILRQDLTAHRGDQPWKELTHANVESLVLCWTYDTAAKILDETASYALDKTSQTEPKKPLTNGFTKHSRSESELSVFGAHPPRNASLRPRQARVSELQKKTPLQSVSDTDLMSPSSLSSFETEDGIPSMVLEPGFAELVTYRASLVMLRRKALDLLAQQRGWLAGWSLVRHKAASSLDEVDLNSDGDYLAVNGQGHQEEDKDASVLLSPSVTSSLASQREYYHAYGSLSEQAMRYYVTATQTKTAEAIMGDLAILKYQQGDYESAIPYFKHVLSLYAEGGWTLMETKAMEIYRSCLKKLDRNEEYVRATLKLLAKGCSPKASETKSAFEIKATDGAVPDLETSFSELATFSTTLYDNVVSPAELFFSNVRCDSDIELHDYDDGFSMHLQIQHLLWETVEFDRIAIRLVSVEDPDHEVWLSSPRSVSLSRGTNEVELRSNVVTFGAYSVDIAILQCQKLRFQHDFRATAAIVSSPFEPPRPIAQSLQAHQQPWTFLYPSSRAFEAAINCEREIRLGLKRYLEIKLHTGQQDISSLQLKLKPSSAGLRLHVADFETSDFERNDDLEATQGSIGLGPIKANSAGRVRVPYSLEQPLNSIHLRLEATYHTAAGDFTFLTAPKLPVQLPIHVDVRDHFQLDTLFSVFSVRTTTKSPLCLSHATLDPTSTDYSVVSPPALHSRILVFDDEPAKLLYKIVKNSAHDLKSSKKDRALILDVQYYVVEEELETALTEQFSQALDDSPFAHLLKLLAPILALRFRQSWDPKDTELAVLVNEAALPTFQDVGWQEIMSPLPLATREPLTTWLTSWHNAHPFISLDRDVSESSCLRRLLIDVEIPRVDIVHKATLVLPKDSLYSKHFPPIMGIAEPVSAQVRIVSTDVWGRRNAQKDLASSTKFMFEITADPETWLIGGQRRVMFTYETEREQIFDVLLIPLKTGICPVPQVDIQMMRLASAVDGAHRDSANALTCETFYECAGQVVRVIRNVKTVRVHVPESRPAGHVRTQSRPGTALSVKEAG